MNEVRELSKEREVVEEIEGPICQLNPEATIRNLGDWWHYIKLKVPEITLDLIDWSLRRHIHLKSIDEV